MLDLQVDSGSASDSGEEDVRGVAQSPTGARLRQQHGVNSPMADKKMAFPSNDVNLPTYLVTQVERPDKTSKPAGGEAGEPVSTSPDKEESSQEAGESSEASCLSFLCCCAPSRPAAGSRKDEGSSSADQPQAVVAGQPNTSSKVELVEANDEVQASDSESESADPDGLCGIREAGNKKKLLVLDLDETLVHSSFKPVANADFTVPIEIENVIYNVYVLKRPYVDEFLEECAKHFEIAVFTASLGVYANPLLDVLDEKNLIKHRLFRESCVMHNGTYVKDLSKLGRKLKDQIFIDNSPLSYQFHPTNAVNITSWFDDPEDTELNDLLPVLCGKLRDVKDVRTILDAYNKSFKWLCAQAE